jgi:hypothetical protein
MVVAAAIAAPTLLYLVKMSITPDHVWAMRRFLPVTLPGLVVVGAWALAWVWRQAASDPRRTTATRVVVAAAATAVVLAPLAAWRPLLGVPEYTGQPTQIRAVCTELESMGASRVLYVSSGIPYLATLRMMCDVEVLEAHGETAPALVAAAAQAWEGEGPVAVLTFDPGLVTWTGAPVATSTITTSTWEQTLVRVPENEVRRTQTVWLGRVDDDGRVVPVG